MPTTDPYNQEIVAAANTVVERLSEFATCGLADSFWSSLTHLDAIEFAELAAAVGDYPTARAVLDCWAENDPDSAEYTDALTAATARYTEQEKAA